MSKASIWEIVVAELSRLESQGKDDHRDSWMGNAIKAVNRLEEHCRKHNAYPELEPRPEGTEITSAMEEAGMREAKFQYNLPVTRASVCAIFKAMLAESSKPQPSE